MSKKFTPGPWKATYDSQLQALIQIYSTEAHLPVAVLPDRGTIEAMPEIEANANLIAAAPDMYEALECACEKKGRGSNDGEQKIQGTRRGNREVGIWYTEQAGV